MLYEYAGPVRKIFKLDKYSCFSAYYYSSINQYSMRRAVVYIKTQRWMFNQSCRNIFREPHSKGGRVFVLYVCVWSMHKTILWFWMKVWTESICKLFDLTIRSLQGRKIVDTYIFCVLSTLNRKFSHKKSQEFFYVLSESDSYFFIKSSNKNRTKMFN